MCNCQSPQEHRLTEGTYLRRLGIGLGLAAVWLAAFAPAAQAGLTISVPANNDVMPGDSGSFDVSIANDGPGPVDIAGFTIDLSVTPTPGVSFTDVGTNSTSTDYLFFGVGAVEFGFFPFPPFPFTSDLFPNTAFLASDLASLAPSVELAAGEVKTLGKVSFELGPSASGGDVFTVGFGAMTGLSDPFGGFITDFTTQDGTVSVIPEPGALAVWSLLAALGITVGWWRRKRRAA